MQPWLPTMIEPLPYVMTAALRQRLDLLHHLLEFGRQLVLVAGPRGSGRTRLLETLMAEAAAHWRMMRYDGFELASPPRLLAALSSGLGLTGAEGEPALRRVRAGLVENRTAGRVCLLVIDDADVLDDACLSLLYELALGGADNGELHVVLAGDAGGELGDRLTTLAPQPALLHLVEVPPLDLDAARALVHGLEQAAGTTVTANDQQVEALWQRAQGRPGALLAASSALLTPPVAVAPATPSTSASQADGGSASARQRAALPPKYLWLAVLCLLGIGAGALLHVASAKRREAASSVAAALPGPTIAIQPLVDAPGPVPTDVAETVDEAPSDPTSSLPRPAGTADADPSAYATVAADPGELEDEAALAPVRALRTPVPLPAAPAKVSSDLVTAPASPASSAEKVPATDVTDRPDAPEPEPLVPPPKPASPPRPEPVSTPATTTDAADTATGYTSQWVLTRAPQSYVVQLFASREEAAAKRFVADHGITARAAVTPITHSGQRWYVVVYGHYATRTAAVAAIAALPATLARLKPWPRLIQSLKQADPAR